MVLRLFRLKKTPQPGLPPVSSAGPKDIPPTVPSPADPSERDAPKAHRTKGKAPKKAKVAAKKPKKAGTKR